MRASPVRTATAVFVSLLLLPLLFGPQAALAGTRWTSNGVALRSGVANEAYSPTIASDGAGGAVVTWYDDRSGAYDIFAQRVDAAGAPQWALNGVALRSGVANGAGSPAITSAGAGGAIVTWEDARSGVNDIYAQRVDAAGTPQWTANGVALRSGVANDARRPTITSAGAGGAVVTWYDDRSGIADIYAQRVDAGGTPQWALNGVALRSGVANSAQYPTITSDGAGGAVVNWQDGRSGSWDIYAQRVDAAGAPQWTSNGVALRSGVANSAYSPTITSDGAGGAVVTWQDGRSGVGVADIYAQRVDAGGAAQWAANGVALRSGVANYASSPIITSDGAGGAVVTWQDGRSGVGDIYAQRVDAGGAAQWTANGVALRSGVAGNADYPTITSDGSGGAVVTWQDKRSGAWDIYAQRVSNPAPTLTGITPASGSRGSALDITDLAGTWFSDAGGAPEVLLKKAGQSDIAATVVAVASADRATCSFDLAGAAPGDWDVYFRNADGQSATLAAAFRVYASFYFAEGYTGDGFQEYLCLGNTEAAPLTVDVTYLFKDGSAPLDRSYDVPALSRATVDVNNVVGAGREVSIKCAAAGSFIAERPMYFDYSGWTGGHDTVGASSPSNTWYFAEGYTGDGFDEYICVLNDGNAAAELTFNFQTQEAGLIPKAGYSVGPHTRGTFKVNDILGPGYQTSLKLESSQPVVAERPMYFNYNGVWTGGHCVMGAPSLGKTYYFAEGTTRTVFHEYLTLQNPGTSAITIDALYQLGAGQGANVNEQYTVGPGERYTVFVADEVGEEKDVSVRLSSASDFLAERPMYFDYDRAWTGGHCVIGSGTQGARWFFAEGYTGSGFHEWLTIQNTGASEAHVQVTYYPESGTAFTRDHTVPPGTRYNIFVNTDAGEDLALSAEIVSDVPVIAERPMYFSFGPDGWTGGHDVVGYMP